MSSDKRYFWFKMSEDFFKDRKIKQLRKLAGGDTYTLIYMKMLILVLPTQGVYEIDEYETLADALSLDIDEELENVQVTIEFLKRTGLINEISETSFKFNGIEKLIGSESPSAKRVREHRARKKVLQCNADVTESNKNETQSKSKSIELDQDKDLYIDQEREKEKEEKTHSHLSTSLTDTVPTDMINAISDSSINTLTDAEYLALTSVFGVTLVDQKIANAKKYKNCMNFKTLRKWCNEELEKEIDKDMQKYGY